MQHPKLGLINIKPSLKAKKIRLAVNAKKEVILTVPKGCSQKVALDFLEKNVDWVQTQLQKELPTKLNAKKPLEYDFGFELKTKFHNFSIQATTEKGAYLKTMDKNITLFIPENTPILEKKHQEAIKGQVEEIFRVEAHNYLIPRTIAIAKEKGIKIAKVSVRKAQTRWGSCSSNNNISLSIFCITLPEELMDYIIYHELAHVKEKNHSKAFWDHLEELLPGALKLDKQMKNYTTRLLDY